MKITAIDTINLAEFPNVLWIQIHTDEGPIGLGETFYMAQPVAAHVHESCAPYLLGKNPLEIDKHNWHQELVTQLPPLKNGYITAPSRRDSVTRRFSILEI